MDAQAETWIEVSEGSYVLAPDQLACLRDALQGQVAASAKASPARMNTYPTVRCQNNGHLVDWTHGA